MPRSTTRLARDPARMYRQRGEANRSKGPASRSRARSVIELLRWYDADPEVTSRTLQISKSEGTKAEGGEDAFDHGFRIWEFIPAQDAVEIGAYEDRGWRRPPRRAKHSSSERRRSG